MSTTCSELEQGGEKQSQGKREKGQSGMSGNVIRIVHILLDVSWFHQLWPTGRFAPIDDTPLSVHQFNSTNNTRHNREIKDLPSWVLARVCEVIRCCVAPMGICYDARVTTLVIVTYSILGLDLRTIISVPRIPVWRFTRSASRIFTFIVV